jgi:hypothetical protein
MSMRVVWESQHCCLAKVGGAYVKVTMVTVALLRVNDSEATHDLLGGGRVIHLIIPGSKKVISPTRYGQGNHLMDR